MSRQTTFIFCQETTDEHYFAVDIIRYHKRIFNLVLVGFVIVHSFAILVII